MNVWLERIITGILCVVLVGVAFQAPISVWADIWTGDLALFIKSWKEVLLGLAAVLLVILTYRDKSYKQLVRNKMLWLICAIALVHIGVMLLYSHPVLSEAAGILINMRIYLAFVIGYVLVLQYPQARLPVIISAVVAMALTLIFAFLQVFVLPRNFLVYLGYSEETILPYLTVDLNDSYIRVSSFLRGPNPLGAYAVIGLAGILSFGWFKWLRRPSKLSVVDVLKLDKVTWALLSIGMTLSLVAIWFSYSRSALIAGLVVLVGFVIAICPPVWARRVFVGAGVSGVIILSLLFALRDVPFIAHVFFHTNEESSSVQKSDDGHIESLQQGTEAVLDNPLGAGIGTTGSPSLLTDNPHIIENQYLYMAHESGILGLLLQLGLIVWIFWLLWRVRQRDWLILAVGLSGVGLSVVGLVLPVWADDTVGITWWLLAGVAIAGIYLNQKSTKKEQVSDQTKKSIGKE